MWKFGKISILWRVVVILTNRSLTHLMRCLFLLPLLTAAALAQGNPSNQTTGSTAVSYSSINQLNQMLGQLDQTRQTMQVDIAGLRVDRWKADSGMKRELESNVESIRRNLQSALPDMIAQLRTSPESLTFTFKLYRNLGALYDVFNSIAESAGAFGSKDEYQSLGNDLSALDNSRRAFADRMEALAATKESELTRLRSQVVVQNANPAPPKKVIVDDNLPPKKPVTKKPAKPATPPAAGAKPSGTATPK